MLLKYVHFTAFIAIFGADLLDGQECPMSSKRAKFKQKLAHLTSLVDSLFCNSPSEKRTDAVTTLATTSLKVEEITIAAEIVDPKDEMCGKAFVPKPGNTNSIYCAIIYQYVLDNSPFHVKLIDRSLCTHTLLYGFFKVGDDFKVMEPRSELFSQMVKYFKAKNVKVILVIGEADGIGPRPYGNMAFSDDSRKIFVDSVMEVFDKYQLDGFLPLWAYPVFPYNNLMTVQKRDFESFPKLMQQLSERLKGKKKLLYAFGTMLTMCDKFYNFPKLENTVDLWFLQLFHYDGFWSSKAMISTPVSKLGESIKAYLKFIPKEKMIIGIAAENVPAILNDKKKTKLGAMLKLLGDPSSSMFLSFRKVCEEVEKGGVEIVHNETGKINSYAFKNTDWVSYETSVSVRKKIDIVLENRLNGVYLTSLTGDDFDGKACNCGKFHLLRSINEFLRGDGTCIPQLCP